MRQVLAPCQTGLAKKHVIDLSRHVEGCQKRAKTPEIKRHARDTPGMCGVQDRVLAPEAREEQRKSAQCEHADRIGSKSDRHESLQSAHTADVLLFVAAMNDRSCAEKKQRLEKGMRDEMKHPDRDSTDAQAHHHVTQLRNGRIGKD